MQKISGPQVVTPGRRWNVRYLRGARLSTDSHCIG